MSFTMATAIKGYRMTPKGPGCLGKLVDILQAHSTRKGVYCVHFPQVDCASSMCHPGQPAVLGQDKKSRKRRAPLDPQSSGV